MAKQANSPNSATSQWFISLGDNSKNLDIQNGGFTAFGEVIEEGMTVLDNIAALPRCSTTPVNNNSTNNCENPSAENFVTIYQITILDEADNTDISLNSAKNTLINQSPKTDNNTDSGGSMLWLLLLLVPVSLLQRKA